MDGSTAFQKTNDASLPAPQCEVRYINLFINTSHQLDSLTQHRLLKHSVFHIYQRALAQNNQCEGVIELSHDRAEIRNRAPYASIAFLATAGRLRD